MLLVLLTVPRTIEDRRRLRPIGRNNERYQQILEELRRLVIFADEVGFHAFATTERHFHSEGYETRSPRFSFIPTSPSAPSASSFRRWGWYCRRGIRSARQGSWPA